VPPLQIALVGGRGRTGQAIVAAAAAHGAVIAAIIGRSDDFMAGISQADVVLDFSLPEVTTRVVRHAVEQRKPLVIGTTGHSIEEKAAMVSAAAGVPVVWSGNYSVGVNFIFAVSRYAAMTLGTDYDVEILEAHHRFKKDAPSGTAARLVEIVQAAREPQASSLGHGREGLGAGRSSAEIGVHAVRGGDVVGDHTVIFTGTGERVELAHRASDRAVFARGALRAARWVCAQKAGIYSMQDVLGLA
jgi:4-hydroxy-tetrahydrodipicolinate reductase